MTLKGDGTRRHLPGIAVVKVCQVPAGDVHLLPADAHLHRYGPQQIASQSVAMGAARGARTPAFSPFPFLRSHGIMNGCKHVRGSEAPPKRRWS